MLTILSIVLTHPAFSGKKLATGLKRSVKKIHEFLTPSNVYGSTVSGASIASTALGSSLEGAIKSAPRPKNIGAGTLQSNALKI